MRFGIASPDASAAELEAYLRDAARDYHQMKSRLDALAKADARIANLVGAAQGALEQGDFDEADARLADAEEIQQTEHTLVQVRKQAELRTERGKAALMKFDVDAAYGHFCEAAAFFESFDKVESARELRSHGSEMRSHGLRFPGDALACVTDLCRKGLSLLDRENESEDWAMTQNNLGNALRNQAIRAEGEAGLTLLAEAVTAYRAALEVHTRDAMPVDWAMTQNNLGNALSDQGERAEGEAGLTLLAEAVTAYRDALEIRTRDAMPVQWAMTQNNLGIALRNQGTRAEGEVGLTLLADAVTAYREALEVRKRDAMPVDWAMTQNNLGNALWAQGIRAEGEAGLTLLVESVTAYRAALEVHTRDVMPVQWAITNKNLAIGFEAMADAERDRAAVHLAQALTHVDLALEVYDPEHMPYDFGTATRLRERILEKLAVLEVAG